MKTIGVTGGIGSGKSVVCKIFSNLGIPVFDSDQAAREIINTDPEVRKQIENLFGKEIYNGTELNRSAVAKLVFEDPDKLEDLNAIVHPAVAEAFNRWREQQSGVPFVIKEAAILFESGANSQTDAVISVVAPKELRIRRVTARDGRSEEAVRTIMERQLSDAQRVKLSDYIIANDESTPVMEQVMQIYQELKS